jgi:hypothetical protein
MNSTTVAESTVTFHHYHTVTEIYTHTESYTITVIVTKTMSPLITSVSPQTTAAPQNIHNTVSPADSTAITKISRLADCILTASQKYKDQEDTETGGLIDEKEVYETIFEHIPQLALYACGALLVDRMFGRAFVWRVGEHLSRLLM